MFQITNIVNISHFVIACKLSPESSDRLTERLTVLTAMGSTSSPVEEIKAIGLMSNIAIKAYYDEDYGNWLAPGTPICLYLNTGNADDLTVIYNYLLDKFEIKSLNDFIDQFQHLQFLARSLWEIPIDWNEWCDSNEDEAYYPVRLSLFKGNLTLWYGDPSYDIDHRGLWGNEVLVKNMSNQEYLGVILSMFGQIEQQK